MEDDDFGDDVLYGSLKLGNNSVTGSQDKKSSKWSRKYKKQHFS